MRLRDPALSEGWGQIVTPKTETYSGFAQLYEKIVQLKMESADGKKYQTDAVNTETIFRIIQSIPSLPF